MTRAEQAALKAYPKETRDKTGFVTDIGHPQFIRDCYIQGYEQAEKDILAIIKEYEAKGDRCMEQSAENNEQGNYNYWDGFRDCALAILREIENK